MAETLRASLSAGQPLGAALKRYEGAGYGRMFEREDGEYVRYSDYTTLEREVERLRKVEVAALAMIDAGLADIDDAERAYDALAEACGRKG